MTKYEWENELKKNIHRLPNDEIARVFEYYNELFADKIERGSNECNIIMEFGNPVDVADKILAEYDTNNPHVTNTGNSTRHIDAKQNGNATYRSDSYASGGATNNGTASSNYDPYGMNNSSAEHVKANNTCKRNKKSSCSGGNAGAQPQQTSYTDANISNGNCTSVWRVIAFILLLIPVGSVIFGLAIALWAIVFALYVSGIACFAGGLIYIVPTIMMWTSGAYAVIVQLGVCFIVAGLGLLLLFIGRYAVRGAFKGTRGMIKAFKKVLVKRRGAL